VRLEWPAQVSLSRDFQALIAGLSVTRSMGQVKHMAHLSSRFTASAVRYSRNLSLAKPGPAMTRHLTMSQSTCRTVANKTCRWTPYIA
jgi:hypothetical protein